MRRVDHLVGLGRRPVGLLEQRPDVVVERDTEGSVGRAIEVGQGVGGRGRHRGHLLVGGAARVGHQPADHVQDVLESEGPGLDPPSMVDQQPSPLRGIVRPEVGPDPLEGHLEVAQPDDGPRGSSWSRRYER